MGLHSTLAGVVVQSEEGCENSARKGLRMSHKLTIEEYIKFDKNALDRHEYFSGEIRVMVGNPDHACLCGNIAAHLHLKLHGSRYALFNSQLRVKVPAAPPYRYPDVSVVDGEFVIEELQGVQLLVNPLLLIEVLSPSTAEYDLGKKFTEYKSIASFQEYLAISQTHPHVIRYFRHPNGFWVRHDIEGIENEVLLESLSVLLPLSEIYDRVKFSAAS